MKSATLVLLVTLVCAATPASAQKPTIFDMADVVVGGSKIPTTYFYAVGKWSDSGDNVGPYSVDIKCYKRFGFCSVASANMLTGQAGVIADEFDILRWDNNEIIAVDSSPICIVNNLQVDFTAKKVALSSTNKGVTRNPICKVAEKLTTAVLMGVDDILEALPKKKK